MLSVDSAVECVCIILYCFNCNCIFAFRWREIFYRFSFMPQQLYTPPWLCLFAQLLFSHLHTIYSKCVMQFVFFFFGSATTELFFLMMSLEIRYFVDTEKGKHTNYSVEIYIHATASSYYCYCCRLILSKISVSLLLYIRKRSFFSNGSLQKQKSWMFLFTKPPKDNFLTTWRFF